MAIITDFGGGQNSNNPPSSIGQNQAVSAKNLVILPNGKGFRKRNGNSVFNLTDMVDSSTAITGLAEYIQVDGDKWMMAVAGTDLFKSDEFDGTMDTITGSLTITSGQNNFWQMFTFEDTLIAVGGAPDAPFTWGGTGNGALLGGSPPSGNFGFQHNNRIFVGNTSANPSRLRWSVLGNSADWSGQGSGFQDVWTSDNDNLVGAAPLNSDVVLLFKQNSIHQMITREHPFPVFPLFSNIGAVSKNAIVVFDGIVWFITPKGHMRGTDGTKIFTPADVPTISHIDNRWGNLNNSRLKHIFGFPYVGVDFSHMNWLVSDGSTQTTNNADFVWDINNRCWIEYDGGYNANVGMVTQDGVMYTGHYDGRVHKQDVKNLFRDEANFTRPIDMIWRSRWEDLGSLTNIKQFDWINIDYETQTSGTLDVKLGVDYSEDLLIKTPSIRAPGGILDNFILDTDVLGGQDNAVINILDESIRGNKIQLAFQNNRLNQTVRINGYNFTGKIYGQKDFTSK